eukprot:448566-Pelagomonas_calceolata.AAC.5
MVALFSDCPCWSLFLDCTIIDVIALPPLHRTTLLGMDGGEYLRLLGHLKTAAAGQQIGGVVLQTLSHLQQRKRREGERKR